MTNNHFIIYIYERIFAMTTDILWEKFLQTGKVEDYLKYKGFLEY